MKRSRGSGRTFLLISIILVSSCFLLMPGKVEAESQNYYEHLRDFLITYEIMKSLVHGNVEEAIVMILLVTQQMTLQQAKAFLERLPLDKRDKKQNEFYQEAKEKLKSRYSYKEG
jgi:hypothetical protein